MQRLGKHRKIKRRSPEASPSPNKFGNIYNRLKAFAEGIILLDALIQALRTLLSMLPHW